MKPFAVVLNVCVCGVLLSSCDSRPNSASGTAPQTTSATDSAASQGAMAGMDHSAMGHPGMHHEETGATGMTAVMNTMMVQMDAVKPTGNADHDFARMMMAHHRGAVAMAALELEQGKDATLRAMAEKISADQRREIQEMEGLATRLKNAPANYQPTDPADPFMVQMKASMDGMMKNPGQPSGSVDKDFAQMMIPHHQGAVAMAQAELAYGRDTRLKQMARQMIEAQQKEIQQLETWLAEQGTK